MENKTEESIIVTIDDTEGNSRDFVQDMVIPFDGKEFAVLVSIPESMDSEEEPDIILARIDKDQDGEVVYVSPTDEEYNGYILAAENLTKERLKLEQKSGIGGHTDPKQPGKNPEAEAKQRLATERRLAQDLAALQAENRKEEIDRMQAGTEKKLAQIEYDYNARKEEINRQEADWKREKIGRASCRERV